MDLLGGQFCKKCGFKDYRALQIDHIYGGGRKELRLYSHTKFLGKVLEKPHLYQILCANCNWIKKSENNENYNSKFYQKY